MSKLPNLSLRMENPSGRKKKIKAKQFHSSYLRAPCLTVHITLPTLPLIPCVSLSVDQKQSSGLFGKEYAVYNISTQMMVTVLKTESDQVQILQFLQSRRYSDFVTLHSNLQKKFPRNVIPPLPPKVGTNNPSPSKSTNTNSNDNSLTESRRRWLCLWLQYILLHGSFQKCELTKQFIVSEEKPQKFSNNSNSKRHSPSTLWETSTGNEISTQFDNLDDEDNLPNRQSSVDNKSSSINSSTNTSNDSMNEAAYYKCTQEAHTVARY